MTGNLKDDVKAAGRIRRKGGSDPWQTLKIPFTTGGPGPADAKEPHHKPQVITCKEAYTDGSVHNKCDKQSQVPA